MTKREAIQHMLDGGIVTHPELPLKNGLYMDNEGQIRTYLLNERHTIEGLPFDGWLEKRMLNQ